MSRRISHSLLDPYVGPRLKSLYGVLPIPRRFPPEGIVLTGHACAAAGAVGLAFSADRWWGGLLAAAGIVLNHTADCIDGTHARSTGQCRNGGELLDHFTDPLSFAYWLVGLAVACGRLDLGLAAVIVLYATAVLTNIRAKLTGEFVLRSFGPTEFKTVLAVFGLAASGLVLAGTSVETVRNVVLWSYAGLTAIGVVQLVFGVVTSMSDVNARGKAPDQSEWVVVRAEGAEAPGATESTAPQPARSGTVTGPASPADIVRRSSTAQRIACDAT